ncbi:hypothetical protein Sjap_009053 [Stephania japonica]|uniref:Uncharacterized protein n=1 Tax=Stephania japonica TaxID=461633 RepID=A0AAP0PCY7_9MAGN
MHGIVVSQTITVLYFMPLPFYALKAVAKLCRKAANCWCQRHQRKAASKSVDGALFEPKEDGCENAKEALKLISKFEELKGLDPWSFQVGTTTKTNSATNANVSTATEANIQGIPVTQNRMSSMFFEGASSNTSDGKLRFVEDRGCGSRHVISDEAIQVDLGFPN